MCFMSYFMSVTYFVAHVQYVAEDVLKRMPPVHSFGGDGTFFFFYHCTCLLVPSPTEHLVRK